MELRYDFSDLHVIAHVCLRDCSSDLDGSSNALLLSSYQVVAKSPQCFSCIALRYDLMCFRHQCALGGYAAVQSCHHFQLVVIHVALFNVFVFCKSPTSVSHCLSVSLFLSPPPLDLY